MIFPSPAGMSLTKLSLDGNNLGDGKIDYPLQCKTPWQIFPCLSSFSSFSLKIQFIFYSFSCFVFYILMYLLAGQPLISHNLHGKFSPIAFFQCLWLSSFSSHFFQCTLHLLFLPHALCFFLISLSSLCSISYPIFFLNTASSLSRTRASDLLRRPLLHPLRLLPRPPPILPPPPPQLTSSWI